MKQYEKIYAELSKQYSDEEIASSMLIPADLSPDEQKRADEELLAFRKKMLAQRTDDQRIYTDLLRFKYLMEDYIKSNIFEEDKTFGNLLEEYIRVLRRTKKRLSEDLAIHYTRLSRIINNREEPNIELMYRLEEHSAKLIPALYWWKLVTKKQEHLIKENTVVREKEAAKVKNAIKFRA